MRKLSESIWADIHKRSNGSQIRKEDDVNHLDLDEFYKYIKDHYKTKVEYIDLDAMGGGNGNVLGVDITEDIILFYKPKRGHILLSWSRVKIPMPFFDELVDRFKVENPNAMRRIITEKDGSCTNKTFIDVINFFIEHKETLINESIWADIHKRSNGSQIRKEDDIDKLDFHEFVSYLKDTYTIDDPTNFFEIGIFPTMGTDIVNISIPIEKKDIYNEDRNGNRMLTIGSDKKTDILLNIRPNKYIFQLYPRELVKTFKDDFSIDYDLLELIPKNGKITNSMCVDVIDKLLSIVERPIMTKNE